LWSAAQVRGIAAAARARAAAAAALAIVAVLAVPAPPARAADGERELTVMTFNIWYGGVQADFNQVARAIRRADADVVGVQEPEGNLRRLAAASGLPYVDESLHIISRYPLFAVERRGLRLAYVALDLDHVVAMANLHLTCCPYGPEQAAAGKPARRVLALERSLRLPEIRPYVRALGPLARRGTPTFLTGDFNSPSYLDWTTAMARADPKHVPYPLAWPASLALARAGLRDSYREAHPDPVVDPGRTWTPGTPPPRIRKKETLDRIDWVIAGGPARTLAARLVGEVGGPDVEVGVSPWGSDHRAVASTFAVTARKAPPLVSADPRVVERGRRVTVRYTLTDAGSGRAIGILRPHSRQSLMSIPIYDSSDHLAVSYGTETLRPGRYRAALLDGKGRISAAYPFWVEPRGADPRISTNRKRYRAGAPIRVRWAGAPGNRLDWIGIYPAGGDLYGYLGFKYTGALPSGRLSFTRADLGKLSPGRYQAVLMLDDGYSILAGTSFTVTRRR
jgi:endonuclease/exonuclease/phosphatase family metal-dependent hydrolase